MSANPSAGRFERPAVPGNPAYETGKRALDVCGAVVGLALSLPVYPLVALALWLDSRGPVFYRRRVLGRGGVEFDALKFRTMSENGAGDRHGQGLHYNGCAANGVDPDDARVTRVGRFLRRTSLDELPQLWNVLRGEMSLVGPRMIAPGELAEYGDGTLKLLQVRPGLTGPYQVGGRKDLSYPEKVRLELGYVERRGLALDLMLLLKTIPAVLFPRGAW
ncbi:MAG: sugar transferase [Armatimonadota bacterium]